MHLLEALLDRQTTEGQTSKRPQGKSSSTRILEEWVEDESLNHCTAEYCNTDPPPKSTIALAFSHDGKLLATSHGDHTVKITCCFTKKCIRTFAQHARTPWVVRFHPKNSDLVVSGSLDGFVRLFSIKSGQCLRSHNLVKQLSSLAFSPDGNELAITAGHRVYIWRYKPEDNEEPVLILKTRRTLRGVHFHPTQPLLLTAELMGVRSRDSASDQTRNNVGNDRPQRGLRRMNAQRPLIINFRDSNFALSNDTFMGNDEDTQRQNQTPQNSVEDRESETSLRRGQRNSNLTIENGGFGHTQIPENFQRNQSREENPPQNPPETGQSSRSTQNRPHSFNEQYRRGQIENEIRALNSSSQAESHLRARRLEDIIQIHDELSSPRLQNRRRCPYENDPWDRVPSRRESVTQQSPNEDREEAQNERINPEPQSRANFGHHHGFLMPHVLQSRSNLANQVSSSGREESRVLNRFQASNLHQQSHIGSRRLNRDQASSSQRTSRSSQARTPREYLVERMNRPAPILLSSSGSISSSQQLPTIESSNRQFSRNLVSTLPLEGVVTPELRRTRSVENLTPRAGRRRRRERERRSRRTESREFLSESIHNTANNRNEIEGLDLSRNNDSTNAQNRHHSDSLPPDPNRPGFIETREQVELGVPNQDRFRTSRTSDFGEVNNAPVNQEHGHEEGERSRSIETLRSESSRDPSRLGQGLQAGSSWRLPVHLQSDENITAQEVMLREHAMLEALTGSSANFEPPTVALVQIWRYGASTGGSKSQSPKKISLENSSKSRAEPLGNSLKLGEGEEILNEIENEFAQRLSLTSSNGEASCGPPQSVGDESSQTRNERRDCPYAPRQEIPQEEVKKIETLGRRNLAFQVGNAALCSEMGVHISPCGKFLILCVAYKESTGLPRCVPENLRDKFELRLYSLEPSTFGHLKCSSIVKAPQCLTSIQFSPTSKYLILAYGRRHVSLFHSLEIEGDSVKPLHTILELWRVEDLTLLRVLPEAMDEINTAAWNPIPGGGFAYGTKEGKVRVLGHPGSYQTTETKPEEKKKAENDETLSMDSSDTEISSRPM